MMLNIICLSVPVSASLSVAGGACPGSHRHSDGQMPVAQEEDPAGTGPAETGLGPPVSLLLLFPQKDLHPCGFFYIELHTHTPSKDLET